MGDWYHATKFAVEGFSDCLRMELKPFGIAVVVIEPGAIRTEWGQIALDTLQQASGQTVYVPQSEEKRAIVPPVQGRILPSWLARSSRLFRPLAQRRATS